MIKQQDLKMIRMEYCFTQDYLAKMIGVSVRHYQRYEAMEAKMPDNLIELLNYKIRDIVNED